MLHPGGDRGGASDAALQHVTIVSDLTSRIGDGHFVETARTGKWQRYPSRQPGSSWLFRLRAGIFPAPASNKKAELDSSSGTRQSKARAYIHSPQVSLRTFDVPTERSGKAQKVEVTSLRETYDDDLTKILLIRLVVTGVETKICKIKPLAKSSVDNSKMSCA